MRDVRIVGGKDLDVNGEDGEPLLVLRSRAIPVELARRALPALRRAANPSQNRGGLRSGTVGFLPRDRNCPAGHPTAFTTDDPEGWEDLQSLLLALDRLYGDLLPTPYGFQRMFARRTPDFVIPGTVFTTATVNCNAVFPVHRDAGNLSLGYSVMTVLRRGAYKGCLFVLPEYRLAVDMGDRDVILFRSDALHGNTPFVGEEGTYERISVVAYYRRGMIHCGTAAEENERAKRHDGGQSSAAPDTGGKTVASGEEGAEAGRVGNE